MNKLKTFRIDDVFKLLRTFRRSLIYQTKEYFQNSTLHGVRYIAESGRPSGEKFMWFCFTAIGAVTALVIIMSLWEKFLTNPTITGLDTDFHNQNVIFPTTVVCPVDPFDYDKSYEAISKLLPNDETNWENSTAFLKMLVTLSYDGMNETYTLSRTLSKEFFNKNLRFWAFQSHVNCKVFLIECKYRGELIDCCTNFELVYTEYGICFAFNSRFKSTIDADLRNENANDLYETDKKWGLSFVPNKTAKVFIFSHEDYFGMDFKSQIAWADGESIEIRISKKNTYTTDDARQLTVSQRKCIFNDEVKLKYFPEDYTMSSCTKECRMKKCIKFCGCSPAFYKPIPNIRMCSVNDFPCLFEYRLNITKIEDCLHCELSCSKTDFNIEKLMKILLSPESAGVHIEFLTWPILRYKREVLFGWMDLLVSFGGIAGLFLGFSLLSGLEIIYYFTMRACCMVYKNRRDLDEIEVSIQQKPPPIIDLSLRLKRNAIVQLENEERIESGYFGKYPSSVKLTNFKITPKQTKSEKHYANAKQMFFKHFNGNSLFLNRETNTNWAYDTYLP